MSSSPYSSRARVGWRVMLTVLWTIIFVVGLGIGVLTMIPDLARLIAQASGWTIEAKTPLVAASVALVLIGLWGISSSHRNLKHAVDLASEVDRARTETIQLESTRFMSKPK